MTFLYIPIWFYFNDIDHSYTPACNTFTFQYGSTLMYLCQLRQKTPVIFKFQYGSTLIMNRQEVEEMKKLYIPIWFYFNTGHPQDTVVILLLYIPIWFYFNPMNLQTFAEGGTFTFQYGSTLIIVSIAVLSGISCFTFQYGSTLIHSCQFRIFSMLICSFLSTSLYHFYFPIHFIMFFI